MQKLGQKLKNNKDTGVVRVMNFLSVRPIPVKRLVYLSNPDPFRTFLDKFFSPSSPPLSSFLCAICSFVVMRKCDVIGQSPDGTL